MARKQGEFVTCANCKRQINLKEAEDRGDLETIAGVKIVYCECGLEIALLKK